jgi:hypothetical protein
LSLSIIFVVANQEAFGSINENYGQNQASEIKTYTDNNYGFSISYPSNWQYEKRNDLGQDRVLFIPQSRTAMVEVNIMNLPQTSLTTDEEKLAGWASIMLKQHSEDQSKKIIDNGITTIANQDATYITYLQSAEGMNLKRFEGSVVVDNILYSFMYGSTLEEYDIYLPIVTNMINSFQLGR